MEMDMIDDVGSFNTCTSLPPYQCLLHINTYTRPAV